MELCTRCTVGSSNSKQKRIKTHFPSVSQHPGEEERTGRKTSMKSTAGWFAWRCPSTAPCASFCPLAPPAVHPLGFCGLWIGFGGTCAPLFPSVPLPPIRHSFQCHPNAFAFCTADSSRLLGSPRPGYGTLQHDTDTSCMVRTELWVKGNPFVSRQSILLGRKLHK